MDVSFPANRGTKNITRCLADLRSTCPNGDFVWSYRFFEATLCGAIPIIEQFCPAYEGFRYRTMEQPATVCEWHREDAEHNFTLCRTRLTLPRSELDAEIASLLYP